MDSVLTRHCPELAPYVAPFRTHSASGRARRAATADPLVRHLLIRR